MKTLIKILVKLYSIFRKSKNPLIPPKDEAIKQIFTYPIDKYCTFINAFEYKYDPLQGLLDYTASPEHFLDKNTSEGRDCDDWARMWSLWGIYNGYTAYEYIITMPNKPFSSAHVITVLEKDGEFTLCNYKYFGPYKSINEAIESIPSRSQIYTKDFIYVRSDKFNKVTEVNS